jgi:hypothetical protein
MPDITAPTTNAILAIGLRVRVKTEQKCNQCQNQEKNCSKQRCAIIMFHENSLKTRAIPSQHTRYSSYMCPHVLSVPPNFGQLSQIDREKPKTQLER